MTLGHLRQSSLIIVLNPAQALDAMALSFFSPFHPIPKHVMSIARAAAIVRYYILNQSVRSSDGVSPPSDVLTKLCVTASLYARRTPWMGTFNLTAIARALDAPAPMIFSASAPGANCSNPLLKLFVKIVSANELNRAPPKYWAKTMIDIPIAASLLDNAFWTATIGWQMVGERVSNAVPLERAKNEKIRLTICRPFPRPLPLISWKPIHFPVFVRRLKVVIKPEPIDSSVPLAIENGTYCPRRPTKIRQS